MLIRTIPSSSSDRTYELHIGGDGRVYCTCPSWKFQKSKGNGTCKHVQAYMQELASGGGAATASKPASVTKTADVGVRRKQGKVRRITPGEI